jgi:hypothetical protein
VNDRGRRQESARAAIIAKKAQDLVANGCSEPVNEQLREAAAAMIPGSDLAEVEARRLQLNALMSIDEARKFVREVWSRERPDALPIQVFRMEDFDATTRAAIYNPDAAAEARWARPSADQYGLERSGELAGTVGPVPYIDLSDEALNELSLLHEISHLLVDTETTLQGHSAIWCAEFERVLAAHVDPFTAAEWGAMLGWARQWAQRKIDADPDWPLSMLD